MMLLTLLSMLVTVSFAHQNLPPGVPPQKYQHVHDGVASAHGHAHQADPEKLLKSQGMAEAMEHVQEHLKIATPLNSTSQQEYEYIFFTYLDEDRNGMLDGLELVKSMIHHHDDDGKVILFSDEELASAVDSTLFVSDLNNDGWISYTEYRKRSESGQLKRVELKSGLILNY